MQPRRRRVLRSSSRMEPGSRWPMPAGKLEQQYSAERIDPLPDGWLQMRRPRAMIYLAGGTHRDLARRESGLVNVPQQAIESGTLTGDVVIRLFVPQGSQPIEDRHFSKPEVIVRTEEASFDNMLGEIRCNKSIRIDAEGVSFAGDRPRHAPGQERAYDRTTGRRGGDCSLFESGAERILRHLRPPLGTLRLHRDEEETRRPRPKPEASKLGRGRCRRFDRAGRRNASTAWNSSATFGSSSSSRSTHPRLMSTVRGDQTGRGLQPRRRRT